MTHTVVVGLGFGDEGKGSAVDWLCSEQGIAAVIRYNGGPQAAHNVVLADGRHHTFAQFGSGTLRSVPTHLSQHMLVNPFNMAKEAEHIMALGFPDPFKITTISEDALLVTPYHVAANRARELARHKRDRHGSCGEGVGEARGYALHHPSSALRIGDIRQKYVVKALLQKYIRDLDVDIADANLPSPYALAEMYVELSERMDIVPSDYIEKILDSGPCVFEGAQGVLLDEALGFHPYTTWTKTTTQNAEMLLKDRDFTKLGVIRTYHTRHGAGPFPSEWATSKWQYPREEHNGEGGWQGEWRIGDLDLSLLDYAIRATERVDEIMLTFCDIFDQEGTTWIEVRRGYFTPETYDGFTDDNAVIALPRSREEQERLTNEMSVPACGYDMASTPEQMADSIEEITDMRPTIFSYGPTAEDKVRLGVPLTHA